MEETLVQQGLSLMLYGMGVVFTFLTLLVFVTSFMSHITNKYFPVIEPEPQARPKTPVPAAKDPQLIAVISAAIREYKARRDKK